MADLKAGSTVGGNQIWNAGSLPFNPVAPNSIYYKSYKVFTTQEPPTAVEVDAVSASNGGTFQKEVTFKQGIKIAITTPGGQDSNGIYAGNGDNATLAVANMDLVSWNGIGIKSSYGTGERTIVFDSRNGAIQAKGAIRGVGLYDNGTRVYSATNPPVATDSGAISRFGDTLNVNKWLYKGASTIVFESGGGIRVSDGTSDQNVAQYQSSNGRLVIGSVSLQTAFHTKGHPIVNVNGSEGVIYSTINKPNSTDVGLGSVLNFKQLKWDGDSNRAGDFEFRSLKLAVNPTDPDHAVRLGYLDVNASVVRQMLTNEDWNLLDKPGAYGTNLSTLATQLPPSAYPHGTLIIDTVGSGKDRVLQQYYPHRSTTETNNAWYSRQFIKGAGWTNWSTYKNTSDNDKDYLRVDGSNKFTGSILDMSASDGWYQSLGRNLACNRTSGSFFGDFVGNNELRANGPQSLIYRGSSNGPAWKVYHEGNKPNKNDVGLGDLSNDPQTPMYDLPIPNPTSSRFYYKVATFNGSASGNHGLILAISGGNNEGGILSPYDIINVSGRGFVANTPWSQTEVNNRTSVVCLNGNNGYDYFLRAPDPASNVLELWVYCQAYSTNAKMQALYKGTNVSLITSGFSQMATKPTNMFPITSERAYTTGFKPSKADVGLGNVDNVAALPLTGGSAGPSVFTTLNTNYLTSTGTANLLLPNAGSTINHSREVGLGRMDFINHHATGQGGGFVWWEGSQGANSYNKVMYLASDKRLYPDTITVKPTSNDSNLDSLVLTGVQHSPLVLERTNGSNISMIFKSGSNITHFGRRIDGQLGYNTGPSLDVNGKLLIDDGNFQNQFFGGKTPNESVAPNALTGFNWAPNSAKYTWPTGIQMYSTSSGSRGYPGYIGNGTVPNDKDPVNDVLGTLLSFKLNDGRNLQFFNSSGRNDLWVRSMRASSTEEQNTDYKFTRVFTTDNPPIPSEVNAIAIGTELDFGTF